MAERQEAGSGGCPPLLLQSGEAGAVDKVGPVYPEVRLFLRE